MLCLWDTHWTEFQQSAAVSVLKEGSTSKHVFEENPYVGLQSRLNHLEENSTLSHLLGKGIIFIFFISFLPFLQLYLGRALELKVTGRVNHCLKCFCAHCLLALKKLVWNCSKAAAQPFPARLCGRVISTGTESSDPTAAGISSLSSVGLLLSELGC